MPTVNLVTRDNGAGLSTDMRLLRSVLEPAGCQVQYVFFEDPEMPPCDLAIFLETIVPEFILHAKHTVAVVNGEYALMDRLALVDEVWAKSEDVHARFTAAGLNTHYTSFMSEDLRRENVRREVMCAHIAGFSAAKGTKRVLQAWEDAGNLPKLHLVAGWDLGQGAEWPEDIPLPRNVKRHRFLEREALITLMNQCAIHVCPSAVEGWGHHITEALMIGATVITTDAAPMNEHVKDQWGILVPPVSQYPFGQAVYSDVSPYDLADAVRKAADMDRAEREERGRLGRAQVQIRSEYCRGVILWRLKEIFG